MTESRSLRSVRRERTSVSPIGGNGEKSQSPANKSDEKRLKDNDHMKDLFDFDNYLNNRIPDTYSIWVVDDIPVDEQKLEKINEQNTNDQQLEGELNGNDGNHANKETPKSDTLTSGFRLHKANTKNENDEKTIKTLALPTKLIDFSDPTTLPVEEEDEEHADSNGNGYEGGGGGGAHKKRRVTRRTVVTHVNIANKEAQLKRKDDDRRKKISDPLDDSLFSLYHKRREKEEKKMGNVDKTMVMMEYDNYFEQLKRLGEKSKKKGISAEDRHLASSEPSHGYTSLDDVPPGALDALISMTKVNNLNDAEEVLIKLRLTIREIKQFIIKFEELRSKEASLKKEITEFITQQLNKQLGYENGNGNVPVVYVDPKLSKKRQKAAFQRVLESEQFIDTDTDEPQEAVLNLSKLRRKRITKRVEKYGPIIKIKFLDGISIVIDPVYPPKLKRE